MEYGRPTKFKRVLRTFFGVSHVQIRPTLLILERENWAEKAKLISKYANFILFFTDTALYSENGYGKGVRAFFAFFCDIEPGLEVLKDDGSHIDTGAC